MCDWTASVHRISGPEIDVSGFVIHHEVAQKTDYISYRGGGWSTQVRHARVSDRGAAFGSALGGNLGFRLVSSI